MKRYVKAEGLDTIERANEALDILQEHLDDSTILIEVLKWMDSAERAHCLEDLIDEFDIFDDEE